MVNKCHSFQKNRYIFGRNLDQSNESSAMLTISDVCLSKSISCHSQSLFSASCSSFHLTALFVSQSETTLLQDLNLR